MDSKPKIQRRLKKKSKKVASKSHLLMPGFIDDFENDQKMLPVPEFQDFCQQENSPSPVRSLRNSPERQPFGDHSHAINLTTFLSGGSEYAELLPFDKNLVSKEEHEKFIKILRASGGNFEASLNSVVLKQKTQVLASAHYCKMVKSKAFLSLVKNLVVKTSRSKHHGEIDSPNFGASMHHLREGPASKELTTFNPIDSESMETQNISISEKIGTASHGLSQSMPTHNDLSIQQMSQLSEHLKTESLLKTQLLDEKDRKRSCKQRRPLKNQHSSRLRLEDKPDERLFVKTNRSQPIFQKLGAPQNRGEGIFSPDNNPQNVVSFSQFDQNEFDHIRDLPRPTTHSSILNVTDRITNHSGYENSRSVEKSSKPSSSLDSVRLAQKFNRLTKQNKVFQILKKYRVWSFKQKSQREKLKQGLKNDLLEIVALAQNTLTVRSLSQEKCDQTNQSFENRPTRDISNNKSDNKSDQKCNHDRSRSLSNSRPLKNAILVEELPTSREITTPKESESLITKCDEKISEYHDQDESKVDPFRERLLKQKSLSGFIMHVRYQSGKNQPVQDTIVNSERDKHQYLTQISAFNLKMRTFNYWFEEATKFQKARMHLEFNRKRQVLEQWADWTYKKTQKREIAFICRRHYKHSLFRKVISEWAEYCVFNQQARHNRNVTFESMDRLRKRHVIKAWFNIIDVEKRLYHWRERQVATFQLNRASKILRAWASEVCKDRHIANRKTLSQEFEYKSRLRRVFKPWLSKTREITKKKSKFLRIRARNLSKKAFSSLLENVKQSNRRNSSLRKFIRSRAQRLIAKAFYLGLTEHVKQQRIKFKLIQAAAFFFTNSYLSKAMQGIHHSHQITKQFKQVQSKNNFLIAHAALSKWQEALKHSKILVHRQAKRSFCLKTSSIQALKSYVKQQRTQHRKIQAIQAVQKSRLLQIAVKSFSVAVSISREASRKRADSSLHYNRNAAIKAFGVLAAKAKRTKRHKQQLEEIQVSHNIRVAMNCLITLSSAAKRRKFKNLYKPMLKERKEHLVKNVFVQLKENSVRATQSTFIKDNCASIRATRLAENTFCAWVDFKYRNRCKTHFNALAKEHRTNILYKKSMQSLITVSHREFLKKRQIQLVKSIVRKSVFTQWFNFVHEERPMMQAAKEFYLRRRLLCWHEQAVDNREKRGNSCFLKTLMFQHRFFVHKRRAIRRWHKWATIEALIKTKRTLATKIHLSNIFQAWQRSLEKVAQSNINFAKQTSFSKELRLRHGFEALALNRLTQDRYRRVVDIFGARRQLILKAKTFAALFDGSCDKKVRVAQFAHLVAPTVGKKLFSYFQKWRVFKSESIKHEVADKFFAKIGSKRLLRKYLDSWSIFTRTQAKKAIRHKMLLSRHNRVTKKKVFRQLFLNTKQNEFMRKSYSVINYQHKTTILADSFYRLQFYCHESAVRSRKKLIADRLMLGQTAMKVFLALQNNVVRKQQLKRLKSKFSLNSLSKYFSLWNQVFNFRKKMNRLANILQEEHDRRLVTSFLPLLYDVGYFKELTVEVQLGKELRLKENVFSTLKRKWLMTRMLTHFKRRREVQLLRRVFVGGLQVNKALRKSYRCLVSDQVELMSVEERLKICEEAFCRFRKYVYQRKAKRIALGGYSLLLLKSSLASLQRYAQKQSSLKRRFTSVQLGQKQRFFKDWKMSFDKSRVERGAQYMMALGSLKQVFSAWSKQTDKMKAVRDLRKKWDTEGIKLQAMACLKQNTVICQFQQLAERRIHERSTFSLKQWAFKLFADATEVSKIERRLTMFAHLKMKRRVVKAWKKQSRRQDHDRICYIKAESAFRTKPALKRPFLVLKNILLAKAFFKLRKITSNQRIERQKSHLGTYAVYLRLLKKSFYGLRLNAAVSFQTKKSKQIKRLIIQRRWLRNLKRAVLIQKEDRRMRTDAAVFRFLSLQRAGFRKWYKNVSAAKKDRIKNHFATALLYKRTIDRTFQILKVATIKSREYLIEKEQMLQPSILDNRLFENFRDCLSSDQKNLETQSPKTPNSGFKSNGDSPGAADTTEKKRSPFMKMQAVTFQAQNTPEKSTVTQCVYADEHIPESQNIVTLGQIQGNTLDLETRRMIESKSAQMFDCDNALQSLDSEKPKLHVALAKSISQLEKDFVAQKSSNKNSKEDLSATPPSKRSQSIKSGHAKAPLQAKLKQPIKK